MEKRIGTVLILIEDKKSVDRLNSIISKFSELIIGRQGIPVRHKDISVISLVLEGNTDEIGALTGQLGRLEGMQVKSVLAKSV